MPLSASWRTCIGRSGNPMSRVRCSTGAARLKRAMTASSTPQRPPSGNNVRPARPTLLGRSKPASPIRPHTASSVRLAESGEWISGITDAARDTRWVIIKCIPDDTKGHWLRGTSQ
jgi:hypothetical protein